MKKEEVIKRLQCLRALDGILLGIMVALPFIILHNIIFIFHSDLVKYLFILPASIILFSSFKIPYDFYNKKVWKKVVTRVRFFAISVLALSPFWIWWNQAIDNSYLLANLVFLLLFIMLYIYNIVNLSIISAVSQEWPRFAKFAKLTRLLIMYIMIAPIFAFFVAVFFKKNSCWEIVIFLIQNQAFLLPLLIIPAFVSIFIIMQWRRKLSKI